MVMVETKEGTWEHARPLKALSLNWHNTSVLFNCFKQVLRASLNEVKGWGIYLTPLEVVSAKSHGRSQRSWERWVVGECTLPHLLRSRVHGETPAKAHESALIFSTGSRGCSEGDPQFPRWKMEALGEDTAHCPCQQGRYLCTPPPTPHDHLSIRRCHFLIWRNPHLEKLLFYNPYTCLGNEPSPLNIHEYPLSSKICDREVGCGSEILLLRAILRYIPGHEPWFFFLPAASVCLDVLFQINLLFFQIKHFLFQRNLLDSLWQLPVFGFCFPGSWPYT